VALICKGDRIARRVLPLVSKINHIVANPRIGSNARERKGAAMSPEIAQQVVIGIALVGALFWLISLISLVKSIRQVPLAKRDEFAEFPARGMLAGSAEVEGDAKALATVAAAFLATGNWGPLKIMEKTDDRIVFERLNAFADQPAGRWFRQGELKLKPLRQNRTQVEWSVEPLNCRWMLWLSGIFQFVGFIALVVGCWALITFVASSEEPAIRWQSIQMVQAVHVLWPPFFLAGRYRKGIRAIAAEFEAFANNLPYLGNPT
jgi:hypothetical protein